MVFDVGKAAARGAGRRAPSTDILRLLGTRPVLERIEEIRRLYAGAGGVGTTGGLTGASASQALINSYQRQLSAAFGVSSQAGAFARAAGVPAGGASFFASFPSPLLPSWGGSRSAYLLNGQIFGARTPYRVSGLYGSISASLDEMGFGAGGAYGSTFEDWRLREIRKGRDRALQALLGTAKTFGPAIITPEREAKEETHYHPDLQSWDVYETAQDADELWAEGVARGLARHYRAPVLLKKLRGGGTRFVISIVRHPIGSGTLGGAAGGILTGDIVVGMLSAGVSATVTFLLTRN